MIGKPIVSIYDGKIEGIVKNVLFDKKLTKILALQIFDDNSQEEKIVKEQDIYFVGQDAITIKNSSCVLFDFADENCFASPVNKNIFTTQGNTVGKIVDVELDDSNKTTKLLTTATQIAITNVLSAGEDVILLKPQKSAKLQQFKSKNKIPQNKNNIVVTIQNKIMPPQKPKKITTSNVDFLIGRKISKNLYADNGELLAKKGTKISAVVIETVCKNGKLKELTTLSA